MPSTDGYNPQAARERIVSPEQSGFWLSSILEALIIILGRSGGFYVSFQSLLRCGAAPRLHPGGAAGGHRDHRRPGRLAASGRSIGPRSGPAYELLQQPEAAGARGPQLS